MARYSRVSEGLDVPDSDRYTSIEEDELKENN
jgi:hypothetical protein